MWLILKNVLNNLESLKHRNGEEDKVQDVGRMMVFVKKARSWICVLYWEYMGY